jgi:hypothetical protein
MRLILPALLLSGCGALIPNYYANTPSMELCRQYLTLPSLNVSHPARARELERRGETCGVTPGQAARAQREAQRDAVDAIRSTLPPPSPTVTCITHGHVTTCR